MPLGFVIFTSLLLLPPPPSATGHVSTVNLSVVMKKMAIITALVILHTTLSLTHMATGDPRSNTVLMYCSEDFMPDVTHYIFNIVAAVNQMSTTLREKGSAHNSKGSPPIKAYVSAQCYGDLSLVDCFLCFSEAQTRLPQCVPSINALIFLDGCFMRVFNQSFYDEISGPSDQAICGNSRVKMGLKYKHLVKKAVSSMVDEATGKGHGFSSVDFKDGNQSVFWLANCWSTLNASRCRQCLVMASRELLSCLPQADGKALQTGCFMRYSNKNFLNKDPRPSFYPPQRVGLPVLVAIIVSSTSLAVIMLAVALTLWKKRAIAKRREASRTAGLFPTPPHSSSTHFKYSVLAKATKNFSVENKLGQGGFGVVYKGVLSHGKKIAVKRLFVNNRDKAADLCNEVDMISTLKHPNLVQLLGCSFNGPEGLVVYEFLPNRSLDHFLFDINQSKLLNWEKRLEIVMGTAAGLVYLHEDCPVKIIHRDIKASNILLDSKFTAKIADFGLARAFSEDRSHVTTAIAGTLGYMAPEYIAHGQLTEKADVYSFGILMLEIVSGSTNNRSRGEDFQDSLLTAETTILGNTRWEKR